MLSLMEAEKVVSKNFPTGKIQKVVEYKELFVFLIFSDEFLEGEMDPYYSVNRETGKFEEFSLITDGDMNELTSLFLNAEFRR